MTGAKRNLQALAEKRERRVCRCGHIRADHYTGPSGKACDVQGCGCGEFRKSRGAA